MPLPPRKLQLDPNLFIAGRPQLPSTPDEAIAATIQDPRQRPTQELGMFAEQQRLGGKPWLSRLFEATAKFPSGLPMEPEPEPTPQMQELVSPEQVEKDFGHLGLKYSAPTPRAVVEFDAKNKRADLRRAEILENAPGGIVNNVFRFGAGFGAAAVDPLNIASAFIPVFGPASKAAAIRSALTMKVGRTAARAIEGGTAGFVGAAVIEPETYALTRQLQLDYSMSDALLNLAFGTILGGGLHVAGGALNDFAVKSAAKRRIGRIDAAFSDAERRSFGEDISALTDITGDFRTALGNRAMREAMLGADTRQAIQPRATIHASREALEGAHRAAVAQTVNGQQVNIEPIFEVDQSLQAASEQRAQVWRPGPNWEDVPPGAILPPGVHVRMDMTTGRQQARMTQSESVSPSVPDPSRVALDRQVEATKAAAEELMAAYRAVKERGRGRPPKDDPLASKKQQLANVGIVPEMTEAQAQRQANIVAVARSRGRGRLSREAQAEAIAPHQESIRTMAEGRSDWADYDEMISQTFEGEEPPREQWTEAEAEEFDLAALDLIEREVIAARDTLEPVPEIEQALQPPAPGKPASAPKPSEAPKPSQPPKAPQAPAEGKLKTYSAKASDAIPAGKVGADGEVGVFEFDASKLKVDAKRFQFKGGGDEFGVSDKLKNVKTFSRSKAGQLIVWEALDGQVYVANGHQRVALAKRVKANNPDADTTVSAVLYREKDGVSAEDAMVIAAAANIAEGSGSVIDMAKIARLHPEMVGEAMRVSDEKQRMAFDLTQLSDSSFGMVVNEVVPYQYAALVGRFLPDDELRQNAAMALIAKAEPSNLAEVESLVRQVKEEAVTVETQTGLFGDEQIATSLVIEKSKVMAAFGRMVRQDRKIFNALVKESERIEAAGNVLKGEENAARAAKAGELIQTTEALAYRKGPISDALTQAAQEVKAGVNPKTAARGFIENVRRANEGERAARGESGQPRGAGRDQPAGERTFPKGLKAKLGEDGVRDVSVNDAHGGELFGTKQVVVGGRVVAEANISIWRDEVIVKDITTAPDARRQGYAKRLVDDLFREFPGYRVMTTGRTDEGGKLFANYRQGPDGEIFNEPPLPKGVEAPPSGLKAALREEPTETPAFRKWFGDSKVVDAEGKPLVVYHGTTADFEAFSDKFDGEGSGHPSSGLGFHFTSSPLAASKYATIGQLDRKPGANVVPAYVALKNPKRYSVDEFSDILDDMSEGNDTGGDLQGRLAKQGYDGILAGEIGTSDGLYVIAFRPEQIKSAIGNKGTFDPNNPSIVAKLGDGEQPKVTFGDLADRMGEIYLLTRAPAVQAFANRLPEGVKFRYTFSQPRNLEPGTVLEAGLDPETMTLWLTSKALNPLATLRHEEIHVLRGLGLFTDDEWTLLAERAGRLSDHVSAKLEANYRAWNERLYNGDPVKVEESLQEEAIARMVEDYKLGVRYGSKIDALLARVVELFDALRNAARGLGFQTADDIIRRIEAGEIGRRAQKPREGGGAKASLGEAFGPEWRAFIAKRVGSEKWEVRARKGLSPRGGEGSVVITHKDYDALQQEFLTIKRATTGRGFAASQPERDFDEIYALAPKNQAALISAGEEIAAMFPDTRFEFPPAEVSEPGAPGLKKRATAEAKIGRKGYKSTSQLTDVVRGMFVSGKPEFGDSVVKELAKRFDVFDEGWAMTPSGYFDRKILVRFDDGMIGEIQIQEPNLTEAKMKKGGHVFYEHERKLPPGDPEREVWVKKQQELYASAVAAAGPEWASLLESIGGMGGKFGNAAEKASSDITRPLSPTSAESTSVQSSPSASTAKARTGDQSAGRPSQFTNDQDAIAQEIGIGSLFGKTEMTPAGEQAVIPGAEKISDKQLAERKSAGGLKATKPQKESAGPLFDDYQADLLDQLRLQRSDATVQKALDLEEPIIGVANCMARRG